MKNSILHQIYTGYAKNVYLIKIYSHDADYLIIEVIFLVY